MHRNLQTLFTIILTVILFATPSLYALEHFEWVDTDANMSVLITAATLDDESLVENDEIGVFTPDGLCAGGTVVPGGFPNDAVGLAAMGAEQGQDNGFSAGEDLAFRVWDHEADVEAVAEFEVVNGIEPVYQANGFLVVQLSAVSPGRQYFWDRTDTNMSILITDATIDGESLGEDDEIGVFTPNDVCAGGGLVPADFPDEQMGIAAFGAEQGQDNGFHADEELSFKLWDHINEREYEVGELQIVRGQAVYQPNSILIAALIAQGGPEPPMIVIEEDQHDFGEVVVGEIAAWAFSIDNGGEQDLEISAMQIESDHFSVDFDEAVIIEAGQPQEFTVTFEPQDEGEFATDLVITSNDPDLENLTIELSGTGDIIYPPMISIDPQSLDFGRVLVDQSSEQTLTIMNDGEENLIIESVDLADGAFSTDFQQQIEIEPQQSAELMVTFTPTESGEFNDAMTINSNDPDNGALDVQLTGIGFEPGDEPHYAFDQTESSMSVMVHRAILDGNTLMEFDEIGLFTTDDVCAGAGMIDETFPNEPLGISAYGNDQQHQDYFADGSDIDFRFWDLSAQAEYEAVVEMIAGDAPIWEADGMIEVNLSAESGLVDLPNIRIDEDEYNFGMVRPGESDEWILTITNTGDADLEIQNIESDNQLFTTDFDAPDVVNPNNEIDYTVVFTPEQAGEFNAALTITSNDPEQDVYLVYVMGTSEDELPAVIAVDPDELDFGRVLLEESSELALAIANEGDDVLQVRDIISNNELFAVNFENQFAIEPGGEPQEIIVTFTPVEEGDYAAELTIQSNDPNNGELIVRMWGTGYVEGGAHFEWQQTDANMSILVPEATLNGESLVFPDEVGVFTEVGVCAGGTVIPEDFAEQGAGIAAFGAEQGQDNGFQAGEALAFRFYDADADFEIEAEAEPINGQPIYQANGFFVTSLSADGEPGDPEPQLFVGIDEYNFGEVRPNTDNDWTFAVRNSGHGNLIISDVSLDGDDVFAVDFNGEDILERHESAEYTVTFSPAAEGDFSTTLSIHSNDPEVGVYEIAISGISAELPLPPAIIVDPEVFDFGRLAIGEESTLQLVVANNGEEPLIVSEMQLAEGAFSIDFGGEVEIPEAESEVFNITFAPEAGGDFEETLTIRSNDPELEFLEVALMGAAFDPDEERHFEFEQTDVNMSILVMEALLNGESLIEFDEIGVFNPDGLCAGGSQVHGNFPDEEGVGLAAMGAEQGQNNGFIQNQEMEFRVYDHRADIEVVAEADPINADNVNWIANGFLVLTLAAVHDDEEAPRIEVPETVHDFGEVEVGAREDWNMAVNNTGDAELIIIDLEITEGDYFSIDFEEEIAIAIEDGSEFSVSFAPEEEGEFEGVLRITSNDPVNPEIDVKLYGVTPQEILPPDITVSHEEVDFGRVEVGRGHAEILTITNDGVEPLVVERIAIPGEIFTSDFEDQIALQSGESTRVTLMFEPQGAQDYQTPATIFSNDPDEPEVNVNLVGTGFQPGEHHFEFEMTDANMSLLVTEATLDDESLVENDEIGVFTPGGTCAGRGDVGANFPDEAIGMAAWAAEQGEENGFQAGEDLAFRVWDADAGVEVAAEAEAINGELVYQTNAFIVVSIAAFGGQDQNPLIRVSDDDHDFGYVAPGEQSEWNVTVSNVGNAPLIVSDIEIDNDAFSVDFEEEIQIAIEEEIEFSVTFAPENEDDFNGTMTIVSNDPNNGRFDISLTGTSRQDQDPPAIGLSDQAIDFGRLPFDRDAERILTISNEGQEDLVIEDIGLDEGVFTTDFEDDIQIAGGQSHELTVTFDPNEVGEFEAAMIIHSNDPDNDELIVALAGVAYDPAEEGHFVFDNTDANMSVLITEALLDGESIIENDEVGIFTTDGTCAGGSVVPGNFPDEAIGLAAWGAEQGMDNGFDPNEDVAFRIWDHLAELEVEVDAEVINGVPLLYQNNGFLVVSLSGERGVELYPEIVVSDDEYVFGNVVVGESEDWMFTVTNEGRADLVISEMTTADDDFSIEFENEVTIIPRESAEFTVTFAPDNIGDLNAVLSITSNDPDHEVVEINLSGVAVAAPEPPAVGLSTDDIDFGRLAVENSLQEVVTITNEGDLNLIIEDIMSGHEVFTTDFEQQVELEGGASIDLTVTFTPVAGEFYESEITIRSNDEDGDAVVAVAGEGFVPGEEPHFEYDRTDVNMSILVFEALLDGETLIEGDEIGVFNTEGICGGAGLVTADFPDNQVGLAAWGAEQDQHNGFNEGEEIEFRVWDASAEEELVADADGINGEVIFRANSVLLVNLNAEHFVEPEPDIAVADRHDFGEVELNDVVQWNMEVTNAGDADLVISAMALEGEYYTVEFDEEVTLEPEASQEFVVTFAPEAEGLFEAELTITSNDPDDGEFVVALTGHTPFDPPSIAVDPEVLDFMRIAVEENRMLELTISNVGEEELFIQDISSDNELFTTDFNQQFILAGGENSILNVTFTPVESGQFEGNLRIESNDPENEDLVVAMMGEGYVPGERHYDFDQTDQNMSVLVMEALLNDESLVENDEIGIFTTDGICAGASLIPDNFPEEALGMAAWGAEQGQNNGFDPNEDISFRVWDIDAGEEYEAEFEVVNGVPPVYQTNGFMVVSISAEVHIEPEPEIVVEDEHDFGGVNLGQAAQWNMEVRNNGDADLVISAMEVVGDYYSIEFDEEVTLEPGAAQEFVVTFAPEAEGHHAADLTITSNDPDAGEVVVTLVGDGVPDVMPPTIAVEPEALNFGRVAVDENEILELTINNVGDEELAVNDIVSDNEVFVIDFEEQFVVPAGDAHIVNVTFTPVEAADYEGNLTISSNDPENGELVIAMNGTGYIPGEGPHFVFDRTDVNMSVLVTEAVINDESLVENDEIGIFTPDNVCAGGAVINADFPDEAAGLAAWGAEQGDNNGFHANEEIAFRVWDAAAQEEFEAQHQIINGHPDRWIANGFMVVTISAEREIEPEPEISVADFHNFGQVTVGESDQWNMEVTNTGDADLVIGAMEIAGEYYTVEFDEEVTLEPEASQEFIVTFAPEAEGHHAADLTITSNDPDAGEFVVTLVGDGIPDVMPPTIAVDPEALAFGRVVIDENEVLELTINNTGDEELVVGDIASDNEAFTTDFEQEIAIAAGEGTIVNVTFTPDAADEFEGSLTITSNDPNNGELIVAMTGTGFVPGDQHFNWDITDANMSVLVTEATINDESLVENDEIGIFTTDGTCAGGTVIEANFPEEAAGLAAWGAEQGQNNGFQANEEIAFHVWDAAAQEEYEAEFQVVNGQPGEYLANRFLVVTISAEAQVEEEPEINVAQAHDFGPVVVDDSAEWVMSVTNTGNANLVIVDMAVEGEGFAINFEEEMIIEPDASHDYTVTFEPQDEQEYNGTITITSNDPDNQQVEVALTGEGTLINIVVDPAEQMDFGRVAVDEQESMELTLRNEGLVRAIIDQIEVEGVFGTDFEEELTIEPGEEAIVTVTFAPDAEQEFEQELTIHTNDPMNPLIVILLLGIGFIPAQAQHFDWDITDANMSILVTQATLNDESLVENDEIGAFTTDDVCAGGTVITAAFPDEPAGLAAWGAEQGQNNGFAAGEDLAFRVWDHAAEAEFPAEFQVVNGVDPVYQANGFAVITIAAEGEVEPEPEIAVAEQHDFEQVAVGEQADWNMEVSNTGDADLVISDMMIEGDYFMVDFDQEVTLEPNQSQEFTVSFAPEAAGMHEATLTITSNDPNYGELGVDLAGEGVADVQPPMIAVDPQALDFGNVVVDNSRDLELTIMNEGDEALTIEAIDAGRGAFYTDFDGAIDIAGGEQAMITVSFRPMDLGEDNWDMTITSNDPDNGEIVVPLTGVGVEEGDEHFQFDITDANMSILCGEATLDDESLVEGDEIGIFTTDDVCAGGVVIPAEFPDDAVGMAAWGAEQGQNNGFAAGEDLAFRVWDAAAQEEWEAEFQVVNGVAPVYQANGFMVVVISAMSEHEPAPEISVAGEHDFGQVDVDAQAEWNMEVSNTGDADLVISDMAIDGDYFMVDFDQEITLEPDQSQEFTVTYAPEAAGMHEATLTITSNDPNYGELGVDLMGEGVADVQPPMISVDPQALDFGNVVVDASRDLELTIMNDGDEELVIDAVDAGDGAFSTDFDNQIAIAGGEQVMLTVTFAPADLGEHQFDMIISSNDPENDQVVVPLVGVGIEEGDEHFQFDITDANMSILCGEATLDDESLVENDEIGIFTTDDVCAGGVVIPAGFPDDAVGMAAWGAEQGQNNGFAPNEELAFRVWDAAAQEEWEAEFQVVNGVQPVYQANGFMVVVISAVSEHEPAPEIAVEADHDFGEVEIGQDADWMMEIGNTGDADLVVSDMAIEGDYFMVDWNDEVTIEPGQSQEFTVTFAPEAEGEFEATLTITSNDPNYGELDVALTGQTPMEVVPPEIAIDPMALDFGRVLVDEMDEMMVSISNNGEEDLNIEDISSDADEFVVEFDQAFVIAGGESVDITVTFTPPQRGAFNGSLTITSNDPDNGEVIIEMTGTGYMEGDAHYMFDVTDANMSILITEALWNDESLVEGNEVGTFTQDGRCAGGGIIPGNFPDNAFGIAAWGAEGDLDNGFQAQEAIEFRFWDHAAEEETVVDEVISVNGAQPNYVANGFLVCRLLAEDEPEPDIAVNAMDHDFGRVNVGEEGNWQLIVSNVGAQMLTVSDISVADEDNFGVDFPEEVEIDVDGQSEFAVTFMPQEEGWFQTTLTIRSNDPDEDPLEIDLFGTTLAEDEPPMIALDMDEIDFGDVFIDDSRDMWLMISNEGDEFLIINQIEIDDDAFSVDFEDAIEIAGHDNYELLVTFAPTDEDRGDVAGSMTIHSNDPENEEVMVDLMGRGLVPGEDRHFRYDITDANMSILITEATLNGESLDEGDEVGVFTEAGLCAGGEIVGPEFPDEPHGIAAWGAEQGEDNGFGAGESIEYRVWDSEANVEAVAAFESMNGAGEVYQANGFAVGTLTAMGDPDIHVGEDMHDFGNVLVDEQEVWNMTVHNRGFGTLTISDMVIDEDAFAIDFEQDVEIALGESAEFEVMFMPDQVGDFEGTLTITSDDPDEGEVMVSLMGFGTDEEIPEIDLDRNNINFGQVGVGGSRTLELTGENIGTAVLNIQDLAFDDDAFSSDVDQLAVQPGEEFGIEITFSPEEEGQHRATLTITSNDPQNDEVMVLLEGIGVQANRPPEVVNPIPDIEFDEDAVVDDIPQIPLGNVFGDPDGDQLEISVDAIDELGIRIIAGNIVFNPEEHYNGISDVTVTADDGQNVVAIVGRVNIGAIDVWNDDVRRGARSINNDVPRRDDSVDDVFQVNVLPVNDPPEFTDAPDQDVVDAGGEVEFDLVVDDVDLPDDVLEVVIVNADGAGGDVVFDEDNLTATYTWQTQPDDIGVYEIEFAVRDEQGAEDRVTVIVDVRSVLPYIDGDVEFGHIEGQEIFEGQETVIALEAVDPNGDPEDIEWQFDRGDLNGDVAFEAFGDGSAEIVFTPSYQSVAWDDEPVVGFNPAVILTDADGNEERIELTFWVTDIPRDLVLFEFDDQVEDEFFVEVNEGQDLSITVVGSNPDMGPYEWAWGNLDDLPGEGEFEATVEEINADQRQLNWKPPFDAGRDEEYIFTFTVTKLDRDGEDMITDLVIHITVNDFNPPPFVENPIPDLVDDNALTEDQEGQPIVIVDDLYNVFDDPETDNDQLEFFAENPPQGINVSVENNQLSLTLEPNFNAPDGVDITIVAREPDADLESADVFTVMVNPVADAPGNGDGQDGFDLVGPADGSEVNRGEYADLMFSWEEAVDVDDDDVTYELFLQVTIENEDHQVSFPNINDTEYQIVDLEQQLIDLGVYHHNAGQRFDVTWWIVAQDNSPEELSAESNSHWVIDVEAPLSVPDEGVLPTEFSMSQNYPNPFNPSTTIEFALPHAENVRLTVWNLSGRIVGEIVNENLTAGRYTVEWNAGGNPAGVYLIRIDAGEFKAIRKAALIR